MRSVAEIMVHLSSFSNIYMETWVSGGEREHFFDLLTVRLAPFGHKVYLTTSAIFKT